MLLIHKMFRLCIPILLVLAAQAEIVTIAGKVVDERGKPVKDAEVGVDWTGSERDWRSEGSLKTDKDGRFSGEVQAEAGRPLAIMALDKPKRRGGIVIADESMDDLEIKLDPLATYAGIFDVTSLKTTPRVVEVVLRTVSPGGQTVPLIRSEWPSKRKFLLKVPAGEYEVALECEGGERLPRKLNLKSGKTEDAGKLVISPRVERQPREPRAGEGVKERAPADKSGGEKAASRPATTRAPALTASGARGGKPGVSIGDYKGRWLVLAFWGTWQGSCVNRTIPWMIGLPDRYKGSEKKLALLSFHFNRNGPQTVESIEPELQRLEQEQWKGRLPFPVLVDASGKTLREWNVDAYPTLFLIDPEGNIAAKGELAIEARLLEALGDGAATKDAASGDPEKSKPARPREPRQRP